MATRDPEEASAADQESSAPSEPETAEPSSAEKTAASTKDEAPGRPDALDESKLAELEAENEALRAQVAEHDAAQSVESHRARNGWAAAIAVAATLALALSIPAIWLNRMVSDTNYYVNTVAPLAHDTAIQNAVAGAASDAIVARLNATERIRSLLPTRLAFVAVPVGSAVNDFIAKQTTAFVHSDAFPQVWNQINRTSHAAFVTAMTGNQGGAVTVQAGTLTLDVGVLAQKVAARLSGAGLGFVNNLPLNKINKKIVLFHSALLGQLAVYFAWLNRVALVLPVIGLLLAAGAFALAFDRRKAALWFGWSLLLWTLLPLELILLGQTYVGNQLVRLLSIPSAAAQNAYSILFAAPIHAEQVGIAVAVVIILAALIAGPSRWARAMRGWFSGGIGHVASNVNLGPFGEWVGGHMNGVRAIGYVVAAIALLLLPRPRTIAEIVWIAVFVIVWLLLVQFVGSAHGGITSVEDETEGQTGPAGSEKA